MLTFKNYLKEYYLTEKSKIVDYYEKHPELLNNIDTQVSAKTDKNFDYDWLKDKIKSQPTYLKLEKEFYKLKKDSFDDFKEWATEFDTLYFDKFGKKQNAISNILDHFSMYDFDNFIKSYKIENLIEECKKLNFKFPDYLNRLLIQSRIINNYPILWLKKFANEKGVKVDALTDTIRQITQYRDASGQKFPKEMINAVRELTVTTSPKIIYRGWYLDGDKLNKIKGIENLNKGDTFSFNFSKPTSWTTEYEVARGFAISQDMIKNKTDGYAMVISYKPSIEDIIGDFRDIKLSNITDYYNQQEILLDNGKHTYKIEDIKKGEGLGSFSGFSSSKEEVIMSFLSQDKPNLSISIDPSILETAEKLSKLTYQEVKLKYNSFISYLDVAEGGIQNDTNFRVLVKTISDVRKIGCLNVQVSNEYIIVKDIGSNSFYKLNFKISPKLFTKSLYTSVKKIDTIERYRNKHDNEPTPENVAKRLRFIKTELM